MFLVTSVITSEELQVINKKKDFDKLAVMNLISHILLKNKENYRKYFSNNIIIDFDFYPSCELI